MHNPKNICINQINFAISEELYFNRQISGFVWKKKGNMRISIRMIIAINFYGTARWERNVHDAYIIRHFYFTIIN